MNFNSVSILYERKVYSRVDLENYNKLERLLVKNSRAVVFLERSPNLIFILLILIEKNITYIAINNTTPKERIDFIISECKVKTVITSSKYRYIFSDVEIICIDELPNSYLCSKVDLPYNDIVYILFTSGSTGLPKGVEVTRNNIINFIDGISEIIDFSPGKHIACFTTVSFDIFFLESIMALYKGLTVVLANDNEQRNPKLMAKLITNNNIDMVQMTPSRMQLLLNYDKNLNCLKNVKEIMIGGESFPLSLLKTLQEKTRAKIYNMYGPTETTIWSTVSDLTHKDRIDIGKPIKNTQIYIVNEKLHIIEDEQIGEICIAGAGLTKGYCANKKLTEKRFIYLPQQQNVCVYRTGDLGKRLPDGNFVFLGRIDNQVKIHGYRIELEEIEANINSFNGVSQSIVRIIELSETDKMLEAVYTGTQIIDKNELRNYLYEKLPDYMIPVKFTQIESFSYTPNGKIDRMNINVSYMDTEDLKSENEISDFYQKAFDIIKLNLTESNASNIYIDSLLTNANIDSITFIKIVVALETAFDFEFENEKLLFTEFTTIRSMIEYIESKVS